MGTLYPSPPSLSSCLHPLPFASSHSGAHVCVVTVVIVRRGPDHVILGVCGGDGVEMSVRQLAVVVWYTSQSHMTCTYYLCLSADIWPVSTLIWQSIYYSRLFITWIPFIQRFLQTLTSFHWDLSLYLTKPPKLVIVWYANKKYMETDI